MAGSEGKPNFPLLDFGILLVLALIVVALSRPAPEPNPIPAGFGGFTPCNNSSNTHNY